MDSCYLCEIGTDGLIVPHPHFADRQIMICPACVLAALYAHPKLAAFSTVLKEDELVHKRD